MVSYKNILKMLKIYGIINARRLLYPYVHTYPQIFDFLPAVMDNYTNANFARHQKSGALMYEISKNRDSNAEFAFKMPKSSLRR